MPLRTIFFILFALVSLAQDDLPKEALDILDRVQYNLDNAEKFIEKNHEGNSRTYLQRASAGLELEEGVWRVVNIR